MNWQMRWSLASALILGTTLGARADVSPHASPVTADGKPVALGTGAAYSVYGHLAVSHEGRPKPIDTVAREEIKQIYTRETIKLPGVDGKPGTTWTPVAALLDWSVRPKFWDQQPIIAVEYLPLKELIFAGEVHEALEATAGKAGVTAETRKQLLDLAHGPRVGAGEIRNAVRNSGLAEADGKALLALAAKVGEETKWLPPGDLEGAEVTVDGATTPLFTWFATLGSKAESMGGTSKLSTLESKALDVAKRLAHYRAIRDKQARGPVTLMAMPRPAGPAMLDYTAKAIEKYRASNGADLNPLEEETLDLFAKFSNDLPGKDRAMPGKSQEFDARYIDWIKEKSAWVPVQVIREAPVDDLARAGYPTAKVEAFRAAYKAVEDEELLHPGQADPQPSLALIASAHDLGAAVNAGRYPTAEEMAREVHFNEVAPFFTAPWAYLGGVVLLTLSLVASSFGRSMRLESVFGKLSHALYLAGLAGFAAGMGLEIYGFYLRVRISGWAPVSNMYETVIWVALTASILGLVLEAIYRRTYAALAASGVALVGTFLAATVPMLDPTIGQLPPVLRSNYWLTIHVLTIVSSYAAFALAMGLGVVATGTYLVATYRRSATLAELALPLAPGVPLAAFGGWLYRDADRFNNLGTSWTDYGSYAALVPLAVGSVLCMMSAFALVGELVNRLVFARQVRRALVHDQDRAARIEAGSPATAAADGSPEFAADLRTKVMQHTAAQIKPMANFIYRSMQVGILLVAAGTFLGGWWADVSWGRFWGWDPKEVWALITLLVYLMPLHGRFAGWVNTFWLVMSSVVCFLSVLMAWYGVNFVLGVGLHSYGFTSGGGQGVVGAVTLVVLAYAAATYWRRRVSSAPVGAVA